MLRAARLIPLHNEGHKFTEERQRLQKAHRRPGWDWLAFATAFQITMLEGAEVVFIVIGLGAGSLAQLQAGSIGAVSALILVAAAGAVAHRPLERVPENQLKLVVAILLSAFGTFWFGEGLGLSWPGGDTALLALMVAFGVIAATTIRACATVRGKADRYDREELAR